MRHQVTRIALVVACVGVVVATVAFSGAAQIDQIATASRRLTRVPFPILGLAGGLDLFAVGLIGVVWTLLLQRMGHRIPLRVGLNASLSSSLAGYLDNLVGSAVGATVVLRRHGLTVPHAARVSLLAYLLQFCGMLVWAPLGVVLLATSGVGQTFPVLGNERAPVVAIMVAGMIVSMPILIHLLVSAPRAGTALARRLTSSTGGVDAPPVRAIRLLVLVPLAALAWLGNALALVVVVGTLYPGASAHPIAVIGAAALASTLGALAFFVPEGFGVRDGVLLALLAQTLHLSLPQSAVAVLALRALDVLIKVMLLIALSVRGLLDRHRRDEDQSTAAGQRGRSVRDNAYPVHPRATPQSVGR